jgi:hypothetical protein
MRRHSCGILALAIVTGCAPQPGQADPKGQVKAEACAPVSTELPADATAEGLAGEYALRMVATSGEKNGSSVDGRLQLQPHDSSMRHLALPGGVSDTATSVPLYGMADIDLSGLGAKYAGDLASVDPTRPGVAVFLSSSPSASGSRIMMRMGSDANRRDVLRFDGAYTVLRVRQISKDGFAGNWESGAPLPQSGGYFCATRSGGG